MPRHKAKNAVTKRLKEGLFLQTWKDFNEAAWRSAMALLRQTMKNNSGLNYTTLKNILDGTPQSWRNSWRAGESEAVRHLMLKEPYSREKMVEVTPYAEQLAFDIYIRRLSTQGLTKDQLKKRIAEFPQHKLKIIQEEVPALPLLDPHNNREEFNRALILLHKQGFTVEQIGRKLGCGLKLASRRINRYNEGLLKVDLNKKGPAPGSDKPAAPPPDSLPTPAKRLPKKTEVQPMQPTPQRTLIPQPEPKPIFPEEGLSPADEGFPDEDDTLPMPEEGIPESKVPEKPEPRPYFTPLPRPPNPLDVPEGEPPKAEEEVPFQKWVDEVEQKLAENAEQIGQLASLTASVKTDVAAIRNSTAELFQWFDREKENNALYQKKYRGIIGKSLSILDDEKDSAWEICTETLDNAENEWFRDGGSNKRVAYLKAIQCVAKMKEKLLVLNAVSQSMRIVLELKKAEEIDD